MRMKHAAMLFVLMLLCSRAYTQARFPVDTAKFAERAQETTDISLDRNMLQFASKFLSSSADDREAHRIIANLDGIYVRTYEFKKPNSYSPSEVEALRRQFASSEWSRIVSVRSKGSDGDTDIYVRLVEGQVRGLFLLAAEPDELTFVHILGPIKPEDLDELGGKFGIPKKHVGKETPARGENQR